MTDGVRLTVVVPTRNRRGAVLRLLENLDRQTLAATAFEVVVVDDGTTPPLDVAELARGRRYALRLLRRDTNHGAHDSRCAGATAARGARVLFLDDDVDVDSHVLHAHAHVALGYAVGPIYYHEGSRDSPFQRFQDALYAKYAKRVIELGSIPLSELYICNASGPAQEFAHVLERVCTLYGAGPVPGDGCDEELMDCELRARTDKAVVLRDSIVWHRDTKTVEQARGERRRHGRAQCDLLLQHPHLRAHFASSDIVTGRNGWLRAARVRTLWAMPQAYRWMSDVCTLIADHAPAKATPAWLCYPPLAIAFWEGMRDAAPSYRDLREALLRTPERTEP